KVALFFLALLPQFCDPQRGQAGLQLALLGLIFCINGTAVLLLVALATGHASRRFGGSASGRRWLERLGGSVLAGLGLRLLLQRGNRVPQISADRWGSPISPADIIGNRENTDTDNPAIAG